MAKRVTVTNRLARGNTRDLQDMERLLLAMRGHFVRQQEERLELMDSVLSYHAFLQLKGLVEEFETWHERHPQPPLKRTVRN